MTTEKKLKPNENDEGVDPCKIEGGTVCCFVARHGQTTLNKDNCFRGSANPPLDATGIKEAEELADLFKHIELSHIFCSDKQRATKTAEIIGKAHGSKVHPVESLRALNVGDFSGQKRTPESESDLQSYLEDPDVQIPGGESLNDFKRRTAPCLQQAIELFSETGEPPLLVAHSSIVHEVGALLKGDHKNLLVEPGGAIAVFFNGSKLDAKPIFKPLKTPKGSHAQTIT